MSIVYSDGTTGFASAPLFTEAEMESIRRSYSYRKTSALMWLFGWAMQVPVINVGAAFWYGVLDEGIVSAIKPRWGILTFHFLNDGMRPSLWHTAQQVLRPDGEHSGIWPGGAPRNRREALAMDSDATPAGSVSVTVSYEGKPDDQLGPTPLT